MSHTRRKLFEHGKTVPTSFGFCLECPDIWFTLSLSVDSVKFNLVLCIMLQTCDPESCFINVFFSAFFAVICYWFLPPFQSVFSVVIVTVVLWCRPGYSELRVDFNVCVGDEWFPYYTC